MKNLKKLTLLLASLVVFIGCGNAEGNSDNDGNQKESVAVSSPSDDGTETSAKPVHLTVETFKQKVFNYEKNPKEWVYEGEKPCIVDFYADWCKPCRLVAPIMKDLAKEYEGQINVYKVDTEKQQELAQVFGIRSIPSVLFVPMEGKPQMTQGALPKETFEKVVNEFLLGKKSEEK
ncbi:MAG: thioredoxin [Bacteroidales bacterium]|nr:thioredoxin [Bacteroidales bacterium]